MSIVEDSGQYTRTDIHPAASGRGAAAASDGTGIAVALIWLRYALGTVGLFLGWLFLFSDGTAAAVRWVCLLAVGAVGVVAFLSHVVFAQADARRLGWETAAGGFQYEVGFANLALAAAAILAVAFAWGAHAQAAIVLAYSAYLIQAGLLFCYRLCTESGGLRYLRNTLVFFLFGGMMLYFAIAALV